MPAVRESEREAVNKFIRWRLDNHPNLSHHSALEGLSILAASLFGLSVFKARAIVDEQLEILERERS
jgi:hypothetical protein